jgi:bisphosphoglycerate-dependent phosphoglycerate mutase
MERNYYPTAVLQKTIRTLDLLSIKQWEIYFPNAYLKDKNNQNYGRIIGIKKEDLYMLKEQFDKLATLSRMRETETKL